MGLDEIRQFCHNSDAAIHDNFGGHANCEAFVLRMNEIFG